MTEVLVTGSSGFVGSNICYRLVEEGYGVYGVDIESPAFELPTSVKTHELDLRTTPEFPEADVIVHLAAHSQVQPVVDNPDFALDNIKMTQNILQQAEQMGASVINASSRDVYGSSFRSSEDEVTPDSPNGYAASKLGSEAIANAYSQTRDVPVTSLRLANVYGRRDANPRVIPIFIALANAGEELTVYGRGKLLDFVHVDDVCDAILTTIRRTEVTAGEAINVGSGIGTTLTELADYIANYIDACPGWTVSPDRTGDVSRYVADISKAKALLSYEPSVEIETGLAQTIDWYLDQPELLEDIRTQLREE